MHINSFQNLGLMGYSGHGAKSINIHIKLGKRSDSIHSQHWMLPCSWCYVSVLSFEVGIGNSKVLSIHNSFIQGHIWGQRQNITQLRWKRFTTMTPRNQVQYLDFLQWSFLQKTLIPLQIQSRRDRVTLIPPAKEIICPFYQAELLI